MPWARSLRAAILGVVIGVAPAVGHAQEPSPDPTAEQLQAELLQAAIADHAKTAALLPVIDDSRQLAFAVMATEPGPWQSDAEKAELQQSRAAAARRVLATTGDDHIPLVLLLAPVGAGKTVADSLGLTLPEIKALLLHNAKRKLSAWLILLRLAQQPGEIDQAIGAAADSDVDPYYGALLDAGQQLHARIDPEAKDAVHRFWSWGLAADTLTRWSPIHRHCAATTERQAACVRFLTRMAQDGDTAIDVSVAASLLGKYSNDPEQKRKAGEVTAWLSQLLSQHREAYELNSDAKDEDTHLAEVFRVGEIQALINLAEQRGQSVSPRPRFF